jgi:hypothetical protein
VSPTNVGDNITIGDGSFDGQKITLINISDNWNYITNTSNGQFNFDTNRAYVFYWYSNAWFPQI